MAVVTKVTNYLDKKGITYQIVKHPPTSRSLQTANAAHVDPERTAKGVLLKNEAGYVLGWDNNSTM